MKEVTIMMPARWDPFRDLLTTLDRANRWAGDESGGAWAPAVDIFARGDDLVFRAEVPGVNREDIDISVENGVLQFKGERKREHEVKDESFHRVERSYGAFSRSFSLPTTVDASKVKATFKDGVLEIVLPKAEAAKPKRIEIAAA